MHLSESFKPLIEFPRTPVSPFRILLVLPWLLSHVPQVTLVPRSAYGHLVLTPITVQTLITALFAKQEIMAGFFIELQLHKTQWDCTNSVSPLKKAYTCIEIQVFLKSTSPNQFSCFLSQPAPVGLDSFLLKAE